MRKRGDQSQQGTVFPVNQVTRDEESRGAREPSKGLFHIATAGLGFSLPPKLNRNQTLLAFQLYPPLALFSAVSQGGESWKKLEGAGTSG